MEFYTGIHVVNWISKMPYPFMISVRLLRNRKKFFMPKTKWALDSGGFTELNIYGKWETSTNQYVSEIHRIVDAMSVPVFISPQDWMCEPFVINKTGKAVSEHIRLTIENYLILKEKVDSSIYVLPVIQGYTLDEYLYCIEMYSDYGIHLDTLPLVGLGSICRRQRTKEGIHIISTIANLGVRLHGFGLKTTALKATHNKIISADSMAWSAAGRRIPTGKDKPKNYANDYDYMLKWRKELLKCL